MNLWIRSQDKERLIKPVDFYIEETLDYINKTGEFGIYCLTLANDDIKIGIYNSKERTLEVLDEIQDNIEYMYCSEKSIDDTGMIAIDTYGRVYTMPQE